MGYEDFLRETYAGADLGAEDLLLLEPDQIRTLPDRAPGPALAATLAAYPVVERLFRTRCPELGGWFDALAAEHGPAADAVEAARLADSLVWEIAELIIYTKDPGLYDERTNLDWSLDELLRLAPVDDRVVIDAGAGTGRVTFLAAERARHVYAVEPCAGMRRYLADKARAQGRRNVFALEGRKQRFLDAHGAGRDLVDELRLEHPDAGVDEIARRRPRRGLLHESRDDVVLVEGGDPELGRVFDRVQRHGQFGLALLVGA